MKGLGDSLTEARRQRDRLVVACGDLIDRAKGGARLGELFRKKLEALGLKRDRLCFHSFRHTVAGRLEAAAVSQTDAARVLGHTIAGMSYGVYSSGPGP